MRGDTNNGQGDNGNAGEARAWDAEPVDLAAVFADLPGIVLVLAPDAPRYTMLAVTEGRLAATMTTREGTLGRPLFEVFPDANPANDAASGAGNLRSSLDTVLRTRAPHRMAVQRYDLQRPDGTWEERHWEPLNVPVLGPDGAVRYLIHRVEDVTAPVRLAAEGDRLRGAAAGSERARVSAEAARDEVATVNVQLEDQALELELANQQLQDQAVELETQTETLQATLAHLEEQVEAADRAAVAIRESEARFRHMADHAPVMLWVTEPDGTCTFLNRAWLEFTGQTLEQGLGLGWLDVVHPDDAAEAGRVFLEATARAAPFRLEYRLRRHDGAYRRALDAAAPRLGPTGEFLGYIGSVADVEERARLLDAERAARAAAEAAQEQAEAASRRAAALLQLDDRLREGGSATTLAYAGAEVLGRTLQAMRTGYGRLAADGEHYVIERDWTAPSAESVPGKFRVADYGAAYARRLRDGDVVAIADLAADPLTADIAANYAAYGARAQLAVPLVRDGRLSGLLYVHDGGVRPWRADEIAFARDVGERTWAAVERVEAEARERRIYAEAQAARAEAERANRAKSDFLAVMSHELRTPLNAIGGYAQLMELGLQGPVTPEQVAALGRIQRGQQHLLGLINAVLNYAKLEAGHVEYHAADVPAAAALAEVAALVAPQARAKGLKLSVAPCAPGPAGATGVALGVAAPVARADPEKVRQVLLNLLSNAVKFTPGGGTVTVACGLAPDGRVTFTVTDTGRGIPADQLACVFEPFVQVDQRLTRTEEGTGLGLAISRDLARGMGGDLTVESTFGAGSTFTLTLPPATPDSSNEIGQARVHEGVSFPAAH